MSYAEFPIDTVLRWCDRTIDAIERSREELVDDRVRFYTTPYKLFGFTLHKGYTEEEARKIIASDEGKDLTQSMEDHLARSAHWVQYKKVVGIKRMCLSAKGANNDTINLSAEDFASLHTSHGMN